MSDYFSQLDKAEQNYLRLSFIKGVGFKTLAHLQASGDLASIHDWDASVFHGLGISSKKAQLLMAGLREPINKNLNEALQWQQANPDHHLLTPLSQGYPDRLKHIATPPLMLMVKGQLTALQGPQIAIVGSRHPTFHGQHEAYEFAAMLAHAGLVVTSGLAKGIDTQAHQGTLDANASTVAVLGSGFHHIYPKENQALAERICEKGALVSEFALHSRPAVGHFPKRNRIVSGLSLGVVVIEAHLKSGSLITARQALEQNRDVFAIPGNVSNAQKSGCHYLIRQGATLVESADQVLLDLQGQLQEQTISRSPPGKSNGLDCPEAMEAEHYAVYRHLDSNGLSIEQLIGQTALSVSKLNEILLEMELNAWVVSQQGLFFRRPV